MRKNKLTVINFADGEPYEYYQKINTKTAYKLGNADSVVEYHSKDIPTEYKEVHKDIFSYKLGAGLWLWKPYIIHDALQKVNDGDWLIYIDSGVTVIRDLHHLTRCAERNEQDIFTIEQPMLNRQFTKRECYVKLGIEDHGENQAIALLIALRKTETSLRFVEEWLSLCEQEELLSPNHFNTNIEEWPDYYAHREDQSLLSILRDKWNLPAFRDPSDYGEMPFRYKNPKYTYNPKTYPNSDYPTVILCNRKVKPWKYAIKYIAKHILHKMKLYNKSRQ